MKKFYTNIKNPLTGKSSRSVTVAKMFLLAFTLLVWSNLSFAMPGHTDGTPLKVTDITKKSYNGSDISCSSSSDAELTITATGGTQPYQYSIDNGVTYKPGNVFSGLSGGRNYIIIVRDASSNKTDAQYIWVNQAPNAVTISHIQKKYYYNGNNDISCSSSSDGEVTISAWGGTGTLQYSKDNGATYQSSNILGGLAAGTYSLKVKDANGCTASSSVTLIAPAPVSGSITAQATTQCLSSKTGSVTIAGSGGVAQYNYSLDGGAYQYSGSFTNLAAGAHQVTIKDNNGCTGTIAVTIKNTVIATISGNTTVLSGQPAKFNIAVTGTAGTNYTVVYKDADGNQFTVNSLHPGMNEITTGNLTSSKVYTLISISNNGCAGSVSGSATITVFSDCKWIGNTSEWNESSNWVNGLIPTEAYDAVIPKTLNNPVISASDAAAKNITISTGAKLTITEHTLKIAGFIKADSTAIIADKGALEYTGSQSQTIDGKTFKNNALHDLIINNTSGIGVNLVGTLDIYGSFTFTGTGKKFAGNDSLTLKSTATETARVGDMTGNIFSGKVTVERFIPGVKKAWRFLSVPTKPGQTIHDAWQEGQPANNTTSITGKGIQITSNVSGWNTKGFDLYTASPSLKTYNAASNSWVGVASTLAPFSASAGGYMVFVRGDRTANAFTSPVTPTVLRTKGELYTGDQPTITLTPKVFMSVNNPFAAPLDLSKLSMSTDLFFYVWDPNLGSSYGGYQTLFKNASGNYIAIPGGGSYSKVTNNVIQSGLAFFAYNTEGGSFTIKESAKANVNPASLAFTPATSPQLRQELMIELYGVNGAGNATIVDGTLQNFDDSYSNNIDGMDAKKSANTSENLSIRSHGQLLAVERKQTMDTNDTTFLNVTGMKAQAYRFEISAANLSLHDMQGFITDKYLNRKTALNMEGTTAYNFTVVNVPGSYAADRFNIEFLPLHTLPVTVTSVKATQKSKNISVEWKVENQSNMKRYDIEKSADGNNFSKVGEVDANHADASSYNWLDKAPATGYNYYRVRTLDVNGKSATTQIVKVMFGGVTASEISIFPNPIINATINLQLTNMAEGIYNVRVLNSMAQQVLSTPVVHAEGSSSVKIQLSKSLAKGAYQVQITGPGGNAQTIQIMY